MNDCAWAGPPAMRVVTALGKLRGVRLFLHFKLMNDMDPCNSIYMADIGLSSLPLPRQVSLPYGTLQGMPPSCQGVATASPLNNQAEDSQDASRLSLSMRRKLTLKMCPRTVHSQERPC
ncbi:unnamed protein product [Plutella xylostella]|uniref:(diamondback moth) hypothetical protein n=1 Tax=Plutella xylostella TaxID=51655 RepID=A0A8S4DXZ9_PLUXY|nr:unnamed protein product [Plutella xylostella]